MSLRMQTSNTYCTSLFIRCNYKSFFKQKEELSDQLCAVSSILIKGAHFFALPIYARFVVKLHLLSICPREITII